MKKLKKLVKFLVKIGRWVYCRFCPPVDCFLTLFRSQRELLKVSKKFLNYINYFKTIFVEWLLRYLMSISRVASRWSTKDAVTLYIHRNIYAATEKSCDILSDIWWNTIQTMTKTSKPSRSNCFKYEQQCTSFYCFMYLGLEATCYYVGKARMIASKTQKKTSWGSCKLLHLQEWGNRL